MRFLSRRRRHPLAGMVVLLLGLVLVGTAYSAFRPAVASESGKSDEQLINQGRQLYVVSCSSCHGMNGEGILTSREGTNYGPPLVGVGAAAVDFQVGTGRMPLNAPSTQGEARAPVFTDSEIEALAAYVASLGPGPAIPAREAYDPDAIPEDERAEEVARGGEIFRTNCTACHNFSGSGGALPYGRHAPGLLDVEPRHLYEAMLTGPQQMPVFSDGALPPKDKRAVIAYVRHLDEQPTYGGSDLGSLGPVSEGLWAWTLGIGLLVVVAVWIGNNGVRAGKKRS